MDIMEMQHSQPLSRVLLILSLFSKVYIEACWKRKLSCRGKVSFLYPILLLLCFHFHRSFQSNVLFARLLSIYEAFSGALQWGRQSRHLPGAHNLQGVPPKDSWFKATTILNPSKFFIGEAPNTAMSCLEPPQRVPVLSFGIELLILFP